MPCFFLSIEDYFIIESWCFFDKFWEQCCWFYLVKGEARFWLTCQRRQESKHMATQFSFFLWKTGNYSVIHPSIQLSLDIPRAPAYSSFTLVRTLSVTNAATLLKLITWRIVFTFVIKSEESYEVGEFRTSNIVIKIQFLPISLLGFVCLCHFRANLSFVLARCSQ